MIGRYTLPEMGQIWSEKHKLELMLKIEVLAAQAMAKGLKPAPTSTQILQRDRHAQYLTTLAIIACSRE